MEKTLDWTLLWTNPSPSSAMGTKDVPLDLSQYQAVAILSMVYVSSDYQVIMPATIIPKGVTGVIMGFAGTNAGFTGNFDAIARGVSASNTNVHFNTAVQCFDNSAFGAADGICIPYMIFGIKYAG